ncbi:MAG: DUF4194 domain-containing protein [Planctomycetales bacterium]|nr:DUF4194 domain-containing protein [Planctomycetales bacterium]
MDEMPEFRERGIAAVKLLQGVLYDDDTETWSILLSNETDLTDYFNQIGLVLVVDQAEGIAYLRQLNDDERSAGYERLPKLFRRSTMTYETSLLCVLLRDEYRKFEDEDLDNDRCVVTTDALLDPWKAFFPDKVDEVTLRKRLLASLNQLDKLKFVSKVAAADDTWEIRKLLKVRVPLNELEGLRQRLASRLQD